MPLFQTEAYVESALRSVLVQTFLDFEVIVVDDGSTDGGPEIVRAYATRDPRIRYLRQENAGLAAARNTGVANAQGDYLAFLDSDDVWLPEKLAVQTAIVRPDTVLYSDAYVLRDAPTEERYPNLFRSGDVFDDLLAMNFVPVLTVLVSRQLVLDCGGFDPALRSCEDYDLWLRLAASGTGFSFIDRPLARYRARPGSLSSDWISMTASRLTVYTKLAHTLSGERRRQARERAAAERELLVGTLRRQAWRCALSGDLRRARRILEQLFDVEPASTRGLAALAAAPFGRGRRRSPVEGCG